MGRDTQEYEILKMLEGDKRFPKVGERVETSEGAAFEIEELKDISNLTLEEFEQVEKTIKELNSKGIYSNDWISVMRRPGTNEVVINDFSSGVYDTERIGNSYYDDTLFYRLEELMSKEDRKKLEDKRAQEQLDFFGETDSFPFVDRECGTRKRIELWSKRHRLLQHRGESPWRSQTRERHEGSIQSYAC